MVGLAADSPTPGNARKAQYAAVSCAAHLLARFRHGLLTIATGDRQKIPQNKRRRFMPGTTHDFKNPQNT